MRETPGRMGTTLAMAVVAGDKIRTYAIGDSRIYLLKKGKLRQLSMDHTIAEQKISLGLLTREEARVHRDRHKLTNCIGVFEDEFEAAADILPPQPATEKCRMLICSDGLTDMVSDDRIRKIMLSSRGAAKAGESLVEAALEGGGADNVTCIVFDVVPERNRRYKLFG
jgi:protein phosphatase